MKNTKNPKNDWDSIIASSITSSLGGAVLGGHFFNLTGALIGGVVGIIVEILASMQSSNSHTHNPSL